MFKAIKNPVLQAFGYLKGSNDKFSLQSRIYHSVCMVTILVIAYNVFFCLSVGSYPEAFASFLLLPVQITLYYLSRFRNKMLLSLSIYALLIHGFFALNFYLTSGTHGASVLSFSVSYFLIIAVAPKRHYWIWTLIHLLIVLSLISYEYHHPGVIFNHYPSRLTRLIDISSTYIVTVVLMLTSLSYIINNYTHEKNIAKESALAMRSLNEEKDKLISIITHDFSSPLTNIQRYLNILEKTDLTLQERKMLETDLKRITIDTQELLNNLLSWTKKQLKYTDTSLAEVNVNDALATTIQLLKNQARQKEIALDYQISSGISILANRNMFDMVMRNLINNALKFTPQGGEVRINVKSEPGFYVFTIADNGIGIPEEQKKDIFSLNIESTYGTSLEKGAGLGLAICKEFTDAQNGELWFESASGLGTAFYLRIPSADSIETFNTLNKGMNVQTVTLKS